MRGAALPSADTFDGQLLPQSGVGCRRGHTLNFSGGASMFSCERTSCRTALRIQLAGDSRGRCRILARRDGTGPRWTMDVDQGGRGEGLCRIGRPARRSPPIGHDRLMANTTIYTDLGILEGKPAGLCSRSNAVRGHGGP